MQPDFRWRAGLQSVQSLGATPFAFVGEEAYNTLLDRHFDSLPGGGAVFAEMTLLEGGTKVVIRTYWS